MMLTSHKVYNAYDKDGKYVTTYTATDVTTEYINPIEIQEAIDNLEEVCTEQFKLIGDRLNEIAPNVGSAITIGETNMQVTIQEIAEQVNTEFTPAIMSNMSGIYDTAVEVHNTAQEECNQSAYSQAKAAAGTGGSVHEEHEG